MASRRAHRGITLSESPHERSNWQDLLKELIYLREEGAEMDRGFLARGRPSFTVQFPDSMTDAEMDAAAQEITRDGDELMRRDRRAWTRQAWVALEQREQLVASLQETRRALEVAEQVKEGIKTTGDLLEAGSRIAGVAQKLLTAWAWLR